MAAARSSDFRDWDIEPETSAGGDDANGFPFYVWRETADNRLTFARPRYCCITAQNGELHFTFFNPSENIKCAGGIAAFLVVGGLVAARIMAASWFDASPPRPYHLDESDPAPIVLMHALFKGLLFGGLAGLVVHSAVTIFRWVRGRFPGEGRLYSMPLRSLAGFNTVQAGEVGALINGEKAKTVNGLTAVFDDGSMMILTGNAWNYQSIVSKHRDLTNAFRTPRDDILAQWAARQKKFTPPPAPNAPASALPPRKDIPDSL